MKFKYSETICIDISVFLMTPGWQHYLITQELHSTINCLELSEMTYKKPKQNKKKKTKHSLYTN